MNRRRFTAGAIFAALAVSKTEAGASFFLQPELTNPPDAGLIQSFSSDSSQYFDLLGQHFRDLTPLASSSPLAPFSLILKYDQGDPIKAFSVRWTGRGADEVTLSSTRNFMQKASRSLMQRPYTGSSAILRTNSYLLVTPVSTHSIGSSLADYAGSIKRFISQREDQRFIVRSANGPIKAVITGAITDRSISGPDPRRLSFRYRIRTQAEHDEAENIIRFFGKGSSIQMVQERLANHSDRYQKRGVQYASLYWKERARYAQVLARYSRMQTPSSFLPLLSHVAKNTGWKFASSPSYL